MKPIHAGNPGSHIPKSAMFLMRAEDRGMEEDADPTDGGQETGPTADNSDLQAQIDELVKQNGKAAVQTCVDNCSDDTEAETPAEDAGETSEMDEASTTA
jgi:hypothetical protein